MKKLNLVIVFVLLAQVVWSQTRPWETFKIFIPDSQLNKTFFQSFSKKPIFVMKNIISLQVINKNSILMKSCLLKIREFQNLQERNLNVCNDANRIICRLGFLIPQ